MTPTTIFVHRGGWWKAAWPRPTKEKRTSSAEKEVGFCGVTRGLGPPKELTKKAVRRNRVLQERRNMTSQRNNEEPGNRRIRQPTSKQRWLWVDFHGPEDEEGKRKRVILLSGGRIHTSPNQRGSRGKEPRGGPGPKIENRGKGDEKKKYFLSERGGKFRRSTERENLRDMLKATRGKGMGGAREKEDFQNIKERTSDGGMRVTC